ncbi:hypothetical protein ACFPRL_02935 [Pseudoclavibacter helvolus]
MNFKWIRAGHTRVATRRQGCPDARNSGRVRARTTSLSFGSSRGACAPIESTKTARDLPQVPLW